MYNCIANIASTIIISKFSGCYSEKNPNLQRKFHKIIPKFRYNIVDAIFKIISRNFCDFFYGCGKSKVGFACPFKCCLDHSQKTSKIQFDKSLSKIKLHICIHLKLLCKSIFGF